MGMFWAIHDHKLELVGGPGEALVGANFGKPHPSFPDIKEMNYVVG